MRWLLRLPALVGALFLAVPCLLLIANLVRSAASPSSKPMRFGPPLEGVAPIVTPTLSLAALLKGEFQLDVALATGPMIPLQRVAVRLRNQVLYSLLSAPGTPSLVVTRGRTLLEQPYLQEYCARDLAAFQAYAEAWLPQLRSMQALVEARGQTFLYVITPSKVSFDPALVPPGFPCPSTAASRTGLLPLWRGMLDAAGIHYVDTAAIVGAARAGATAPLFPRGGTHWTMVGAAMAAQAIGARLDALRGDETFAPFSFTWQVTRDPVYPDDDLARLMNLIQHNTDYPVPLVSFTDNATAAPCAAVSVAIVGGSFMHQVAQILGRGRCRPHFDQWEYWQVTHLVWPQAGAIFKVAAMDPAIRTADVLGASVVLYEENEQNLARTRHGPAMLAFLQSQAGTLPR